MGTFADFLNDVEEEKPQSKNVPAPIRNNNPGALMPGGKLAQYKTPEEGLAAIDKNLASYGKKGVSTLADVISKWAPPSENDTNSYISHVAKVTGLDPNQKIDLSNPLIRHQISAGIVQQENGTKAIYQSSGKTQIAPAMVAESAKSDFSSFLQDISEPTTQPEVAPTPIVQKAQPTTQPAPRQMNVGEKMYQDRIDALKNVASNFVGERDLSKKNAFEKMAQSHIDALKNLGIGLSSLADVTVGGVIPSVAGATTYPLARFLRSDEEAKAITNQVTSALEKPFGKTLGVTETPAYKGEASRRLMDLVGESLGEGINAISEKTGIPTGDVQSYINSLMLAAGKPVSQAAGKVVEPVGQAMGKAIEIAKPQVTTAINKVGETASNLGTSIINKGQQLAKEFKEVTANPVNATIAQPGEVMAGSAGAARVAKSPYKLSGEEYSRGDYPLIKLSKIAKDVPAEEQKIRAQVVNEISTNKNAIRTGVITGNEDTLRNEHTEAKSSNQTPKAQLLREQITNEQNDLSNYAQKRIENTGASPTLTSDYERGQAINDAFAGDQGLTGFFKNEKNRLYDEAKAKVGENPINTYHVDNLLSNEQFRAGLGLKGNEGVASSAEKLIKLASTVGFEDDFGNKFAPNTIGAWDAVRKSLNSEWTPSNASVIRKINNAIDKDIAGAGGQELYKKADQLHQAEKTLFGSKGIKSIFGDIDPNGVQTGTPFEQIPAKLNKIPKDEWAHIYDTADKISKGVLNGPIEKETGLPKWTIEVPEEVRQNAERAKAEIKGAIAREIYQKGAEKVGVWNQNSVNEILNARSEKIKHAFDPAEQRAFDLLNRGGQIMPGIHSYEGGGQQAQRIGIIASNAPKIVGAAGATAGGAAFGPYGAAVGGYVGQKAGTAFAESSLEKALNKAAEETRKEMKKNAQKANILNLRDNKKD